MMFKKIRLISIIIAEILSLVLIADGLYEVIVMQEKNWGLILIGGCFLLAVGHNIFDHMKRKEEDSE